MKAVCETADRLIEDGKESAPRIDERNREMQGKWEELEKALTYFLDVSEAEAWMSEQELYMMDDNRKRTTPALWLFSKNIAFFTRRSTPMRRRSSRWASERANALIGLGDAASFDTEAVKRAQENLDALYAALKALAEKRGLNLDESYKLFQLNREVSPLQSVEEFEVWAGEKESVAQSKELGQDFEHCEFTEFARSTNASGTERLNAVNGLADSLIESGHSEKATIQEWQAHVKGLWDRLLDLIEKRRKSLGSAFEIKRFYRDVDDVKSQIQDKLLFSFLLCSNLLKAKNQLNQDEFLFLLTGGVGLENKLANPAPSWLSDKSWDEICRMCDLPALKNFRSHFEKQTDD
ncbi:spectrin beta chain-like [Oscarella lobularis]|uniref:spectrin beta chain-like n=1 Tax=Oscarella lobularis TaxID=121494 RepID=UPI0033140B03